MFKKNSDYTNLSVSIAEISAATNQENLEARMHDLATRYGVESVAYLGTGIAEIRRQEPYLAVTYSSEWVEHYKQQDYVNIDPVVQKGLRRLLPLDWAEFGKPEGKLRTFFGEAREFGLGRHGFTIPVHGRGDDRALFTVTSNLPDREWKRERLSYVRDFQVLAVYIHDLVLRLERQPHFDRKLSPRELECLQWAAEGKTAWACAMILGLSEHTVRGYLETARGKLAAASNTNAVSIVHRIGLFPPDL